MPPIFTVTQPIQMQEGMILDLHGGTIRLANGVNNSLIKADGVGNWQVRNAVLDANQANQVGISHAIHVTGGTGGWLVENCLIQETRNHGVFAESGGGTIRHNTFSAIWGNGIRDIAGNLYEGNIFRWCGDYALAMYTGRSVNDYVLGGYNTLGGWNCLPGGGQCKIVNPYCGSVATNGIYIGQASGQNQIIGGSLHEAGGCLVYLYQAIQTEIVGLVLCGAIGQSGAQDGVFVYGSKRASIQISANNIACYGVRILSSQKIKVHDSDFSDCSGRADGGFCDVIIENAQGEQESLDNIVMGNTHKAGANRVGYHVQETGGNRNIITRNIGNTGLSGNFTKVGVNSVCEANIE